MLDIIIGAIVGGTFGVFVMCLVQINRDHKNER